jgi:hypothetical protein
MGMGWYGLGGDGTSKFEWMIDRLESGADRAAVAARDAEVCLAVLGNHPMVNGRETEDRADLELPPDQDRLLRALHAANPNTIAVLTSSYPYAVSWAQEHLPALIWSAHGGQEYGNALAAVLFEDSASQYSAQLSGSGSTPPVVLLRVGDPLTGPVVARLTVPEAGPDRYTWHTATSPLAAVGSGPVDLYAGFASPGTCLRQLDFHPC